MNLGGATMVTPDSGKLLLTAIAVQERVQRAELRRRAATLVPKAEEFKRTLLPLLEDGVEIVAPLRTAIVLRRSQIDLQFLERKTTINVILAGRYNDNDQTWLLDTIASLRGWAENSDPDTKERIRACLQRLSTNSNSEIQRDACEAITHTPWLN